MKYYDEIKNQLIDNEINHKVKNYSINKSDLDTYYNVGKLLNDAGKHYGEDVIGTYLKKLVIDVGKKYNTTNLKRMRQFYLLIQKGAPLAHQLSWSHYVELLPIKNNLKINYYINLIIKYSLSRNDIRKRIKSKEYERLPDETKEKLKRQEGIELKEIIPNPIIIKNTNHYENISEKVLQKIIMEDIPFFLKQLGEGFTFIDEEYKIKLNNRYNYIDLLLYNVKYHCYVVVELKINELDKRDIGQVEIYMNYIDRNVKENLDNKTLGIILCKEDNQLIIKYSSDERIISRRYLII